MSQAVYNSNLGNMIFAAPAKLILTYDTSFLKSSDIEEIQWDGCERLIMHMPIVRLEDKRFQVPFAIWRSQDHSEPVNLDIVGRYLMDTQHPLLFYMGRIAPGLLDQLCPAFFKWKVFAQMEDTLQEFHVVSIEYQNWGYSSGAQAHFHEGKLQIVGNFVGGKVPARVT